MEHRWGSRISVDLPVRISGVGVGGRGVLRDLSVSGGFVETALPLAALALVRIQIPRGMDGSLPTADVWGFVVRRTTQGAGIEWCELAPARLGQRMLDEYQWRSFSRATASASPSAGFPA